MLGQVRRNEYIFFHWSSGKVIGIILLLCHNLILKCQQNLAGNIRGWRFWQVDERIYWLYRPIGKHIVGTELESRHAKVSSIWRLKPAKRMDSHPSPFPIELTVRAIYSIPGDLKKIILDPFCGTGTTLVAAKILGHNFIGIDISPTYVEHTKNRLENWENEKSEVEKEKKKHVVRDPFKERKKRGTVTWPFAPNNNSSK